MDWLKDKKNQPIVAAGLAVIIIGAAVAVYFTMFAGGGATTTTGSIPPTTTTATGTPTDMSAGYPPGTTPTPGTPGAAVAAPAPIPPGGAVPMEVWRGDPFLPAGYKKRPIGPKPKPPIRDLPFNNFSRWVEEKRKQPLPDLVQPVRRMAGIIVSDRIYAIIETVGSPKMEIVQPGDMLEDRLAKVERIERDKVIVKTMDKVPKYIIVRMTSSPRTATNVTPPTTGGEGPPSSMGPGGRGRPYPGASGIEPMAPM